MTERNTYLVGTAFIEEESFSEVEGKVLRERVVPRIETVLGMSDVGLSVPVLIRVRR